MAARIDALAQAREWRVVNGLDGEEILLLLVARGVSEKDAHAVVRKIADVKPRRLRHVDALSVRDGDH
jgi:hypothetical protein